MGALERHTETFLILRLLVLETLNSGRLFKLPLGSFQQVCYSFMKHLKQKHHSATTLTTQCLMLCVNDLCADPVVLEAALAPYSFYLYPFSSSSACYFAVRHLGSNFWFNALNNINISFSRRHTGSADVTKGVSDFQHSVQRL